MTIYDDTVVHICNHNQNVGNYTLTEAMAFHQIIIINCVALMSVDDK